MFKTDQYTAPARKVIAEIIGKPGFALRFRKWITKEDACSRFCSRFFSNHWVVGAALFVFVFCALILIVRST